MATRSQESGGRDSAFSLLNAAIESLNLAKEISSVTPAKAVLGSVSVLLTMIRARFFLSHMATSSRLTFIQDLIANDQDYVDLGLSCADICRALDRGINGKRLNDVSKSVREAIFQLTT